MIVSTTALARARAGDGEAFRELTDPYRRELVLRDVLGYPAAQAAAMLAVTGVSVNSALQRARATP